MNQFLVACFVHVGNIACGCFRNHAKITCLNYNYSQNYDLRNSLMQIKISFVCAIVHARLPLTYFHSSFSLFPFTFSVIFVYNVHIKWT